MFGALLKLFRQEKPDIVHLHSSKVGALGSLAARIARVPRIVFTAHGWAFRESRNFLTRLIIWKISLLTVLMCHTTICVSEKDRRAFRLLGKKVVTIHNEVPMRSDILFRDDARAALGIKSNADKIIGVVAELSANKNVALSIESVASAREAGAHLQLIIMGDGEERTELQKKALEIQPKSAITFLGTVPDAAKYLHAFDALILPSKKEGLPYIILEAHQASVPVIASDTGGVSEITNENDTLCPVDDKRCFVAALKAVTQASPMKLMNSNFEKMIASTIKTYL